MTTATSSLPSSAAPIPNLRHGYNRFIERHETAWELTFTALAVAFIALGMLDDQPTDENAYAMLEWLITCVFALEVFSRLIASYDRRRYVIAHWPDLLALVPVVRGLRILRLLRVLRLARVFSGLYRAGMKTSLLARNQAFVGLVMTWIGLGVVCTIVLYAAEHADRPDIFRNPFDGVWWAVGALTTVGSNLSPETPEGRIAAIALMVIGAFLFAAITAQMTSFLVTPATKPAAASSLLADLERLSALHDRGKLTAIEFAAAKVRVLDGSRGVD